MKSPREEHMTKTMMFYILENHEIGDPQLLKKGVRDIASRRFDSTSRRAASMSPCSRQRTASSCSSSREIGACCASSAM